MGERTSAWSSERGGMGGHAGDRPGLAVTTPDVLGGCFGPDRMGAGPKLGRTIQRGGVRGGNERELQSPPAAIEVYPSDQL